MIKYPIKRLSKFINDKVYITYFNLLLFFYFL